MLLPGSKQYSNFVRKHGGLAKHQRIIGVQRFHVTMRHQMVWLAVLPALVHHPHLLNGGYARTRRRVTGVTPRSRNIAPGQLRASREF
jgi:hypothetical protein